MTYGLILVFEELRSMLVGDDVHGVQPPAILTGTLPLGEVMTYPVYRLFISAVCLALAACMWYVLIARTRLGMMIRAGSTNREMVGVPGHRRGAHRAVFAIGVGHRGAGGHGGGAGVVGLPGMGKPGADRLLRGGGDRRHRLGARRAAGGAADRHRRHLRQRCCRRRPACWSTC